MANYISSLLLVLFIGLIPSSAFAIDIWHSSETFAGQGYVSYEFTLDGEDLLINNDGAEDLVINFDIYENNQKVEQAIIKIPTIANSNADRYQVAYLELANVSPNLFVITKATATIKGKRVDLLKDNGISWRKFISIPIKIK